MVRQIETFDHIVDLECLFANSFNPESHFNCGFIDNYKTHICC